MFYKEVNLKKRGEMIEFLKKHLRYHSMNSWNRSTSYANNIKLHNVDKPDDIDSDTWWEMYKITTWQEKLSDLLEEFGRNHNWLWQAGINGRSGGYVVLYQGGIKPSGYKSYCTHCGQKNYQAVPEGQKGACGRCGAKERINFKQTHMQVFTWPGKDVDMGEDFHNWGLFELKERVELVQELDRLCDSIVETFVDTCRSYRIVEEEIFVPKTIKMLEPV
ncbi:MAG TPA: hypothetical protein PKB02_01630 [Anaerohalosphaeraceae bacterium]|nr:hypothetical protein [Anaerohalosphaeraceae bacterium]